MDHTLLSGTQEVFRENSLFVDASLPLLEQLDSIQIVFLLLALERKFGVSLESFEVTPENFRDLKTLAALLEQKLARK